MIPKITILLLCSVCMTISNLYSQGLTAVMVNSNGVVQRPTNFFNANNLDSNARFDAPLTSSLSLFTNTGGEVVVTNNAASFTVLSGATNAKAALRLFGSVNQRRQSGIGTVWNDGNVTAYITFEVAARVDGLMRFVVGNADTTGTNMSTMANYPTNRAIGFELRSVGAGDFTNEARLIAHNGSSSTNGNWVEIGSVFDLNMLAIDHTSTGSVSLRVGRNNGQLTNLAGASITGGPTNNPGGGGSTMEVGIFVTNTNAINRGFTVYKASYEVIK